MIAQSKAGLNSRLIMGFFFTSLSIGKACVLPFLTLLFKHVGLTPIQSGSLRAIQAIVAMPFTTLVIHVASTYKKQKIFLVLGIAVTITTYVSLTLVPQIREQKLMELERCGSEICHPPVLRSEIDISDNGTKQSDASIGTRLAKLLFKTRFDGCHLEVDPSRRNHWCLERLATFLVFLIILICCSTLGSPVDKLADDSWYRYLEERDSLDVYGEHKIFTSAFTALALIVVSAIVSTSNPQTVFNLEHFCLYFYVFGAVMIVPLILSPLVPLPETKQAYESNAKKILTSYRIIFCDMRTLLFTISVLMSGILYACFHDFLLWYMHSLGATEYTLALAVCFSLISEIPIPMIYKTVIKTISLNGTITATIFIYGFRYIFLAVVWSPYAALPLQFLHGISSSLMWHSALVHIDQVSNPGMDRYVHSVLYMLHWGVGYAIGTSTSGFIYENFGPHLMFWIFGIASFVWGFLFLILQYHMPRLQKRTYSKLLLCGKDDSERVYRLLHSSNSDSEDELWSQNIDRIQQRRNS